MANGGEMNPGNPQNLLELASNTFGQLSEAENILFRAVGEGKPADFSAKDEDKNSPLDYQKWGNNRTLQAEKIRWICEDIQAKTYLTSRGIHIRGLRIKGQLDLEFQTIAVPLIFENIAAPDGIILDSANIRALYLTGSHIGSIQASGINVQGSVFFDNGFTCNGETNLNSANIGGVLSKRSVS